MNASVTLPPEILDNILEQIPTTNDRRPTLIACALVATRWTGPSQRCLFSSVDIHERNYERWMNGAVLSGSKARLLEHVRSMWHSGVGCKGIEYRMQDLTWDSREYFPALRNLRSLTFFKVRIEHIGEEEFCRCFSAFRETLTHLSLYSFATSFSAFTALVDHFPNVTTLRLDSFKLEPESGPVPPLSRPLRGKLHVYDVSPDCLEFLNRFVELDLEYEELVLDSSCTSMETEFVQSALQISASTVKFLRLTAELCPRRELPLFTIQ